MIGFHASLWETARTDLAEERERIHRAAIREARLASEEAAAGSTRQSVGLLRRVRMALGITPQTTQPDCVACAA